MSKEYQQLKYKSFVMPKEVYYQAIWAIRDLDRMENRLEEIADDKANYYKEYSILSDRVENIYSAINDIPEPYKEKVIGSIERKKTDAPATRMWKYWKQRFLYTVAKNLRLF